MKDKLYAIGCELDELTTEIDLALDALSIIHEAMTTAHPKAEQFSNAICSVYLNLCNLTEQLHKLTDKTMREDANAEPGKND